VPQKRGKKFSWLSPSCAGRADRNLILEIAVLTKTGAARMRGKVPEIGVVKTWLPDRQSTEEDWGR
jgi:hypothetical protein